jgi:hypothetical protein
MGISPAKSSFLFMPAWLRPRGNLQVGNESGQGIQNYFGGIALFSSALRI